MLEFYEGREKVVRARYHRGSALLTVPRECWEKLLKEADCEIISEIEGEQVRAFLLSESSLFVWSNHLILKTCGTTTPLSLIRSLEKTGLQGISYQHGAFLRPHEQQHGYRTYAEVKKEVLETSLDLKTPVLVQDNIFADGSMEFQSSSTLPYRGASFLDVKISNIAHDCLYNAASSKEHLTKMFCRMFPGTWSVDIHHFEPCGFSLNAISFTGEKYATIHVTPEAKFSYASFETNDMNLLAREITFIVKLFVPGNMDIMMFWPDKSARKALLKKIMKRMSLQPGKSAGKKTQLFQFVKKT